MSKQPKAVGSGPADIRRRFDALFEKVNNAGKRANERDVKDLRALMRAHEGEALWRRVADPGQAAIDYLLQQRIAGAAMSEAWRERVEDFKKEMGHRSAPPVERLLIQHVALCWLQLNFIELKYADILGGASNPTLEQGRHWDRRLNLAQRRFTRAAVELERLRALGVGQRRAELIGPAHSSRVRRVALEFCGNGGRRRRASRCPNILIIGPPGGRV